MVTFTDFLFESFKGKMKIGKWNVFFQEKSDTIPDIAGRRAIVNVETYEEAREIRNHIHDPKRQIYVSVYDGKWGGYAVYITTPGPIHLTVAVKKLKELS